MKTGWTILSRSAWQNNKKSTIAGAVLFISLVVLTVADLALPLSLPEKRASFATVVLDSDGYPLRAFADEEGIWRYQVTVDQVSPLYIEALLGYEDRFFYQHPGINPASLLRAAFQFVRNGQIVSGGSTLTMQVARILHPHSRSFAGKFYQMFRALQLEWHLSKTEILELYLNYAPFGGTIEGVQAASFQYFQKPASQLRRSEAALLAVLPQAPSRLRPDRHSERAQAARDKVLDRLATFGIWSRSETEYAGQESVAAWAPDSPMVAPILARRLKQQYPDKTVIQTTIDRNLQQPVEELVKGYASTQGEKISVAVLVVENTTSDVKAYVASSDFTDANRAGQVDMIEAIRSPGSTLKPLLYGLAIDDHLIHSESLMADVPRVARQYRPGNFSRGFAGPVSASEALQRSLNIPFVQLIEAYGEQRFTNRLTHVLQPLSIPGDQPSAAIILGGAGSSLERLVALYSAFANGGYVNALQFTVSDSEQARDLNQRRLLSEEAAWITYDAMRGVRLPADYTFGLSRQLLPKVAWKTGTSYGHRDAWAIGITRDYTIGVWLGRPDGQPMRRKMGITSAGPVLFTVFGMVNPDSALSIKPEGVQQVTVCWPDGRALASVPAGCDEQHSAWTRHGITPRTLEPESDGQFYNPQQTILVNSKTGLRINRHCDISQKQLKALTLWPAALDAWLPAKLQRNQRLPGFDPGCLTRPLEEKKLRLVGAENGQIFHSWQDGRLAINLQVEGASGTTYWYKNGELLPQRTDKHRLFLEQLEKGENQILVMDDSGAMGSLTLIGI